MLGNVAQRRRRLVYTEVFTTGSSPVVPTILGKVMQSRINMEYLNVEQLRQAASKIKWTNPSGLLWTKCPKCGGRVHDVGTGLIRQKCSRCGEFYSDVRIGA